MQKRDSHYERIILIVAAVLAIGVSVWLVMQAMAFDESLQTRNVKAQQDFGNIPIEGVDKAIATLTAPFQPWLAPIRSNKPVPLNKSVLLVLKDDQIFDMFMEDPPLRPPMTNEYLRKYDLDFLSPNVGDLDPDADGFSNQEEALAGTDPKNPESHPAITDKLAFLERISHDYIVLLSSSSAPYQVSITPPGGQRRGLFIDPKPGLRFGPSIGPNVAPTASYLTPNTDGRFEFVSFEAKKIPDPRLGEKDISEMTIQDRLRGDKQVLVMKTPLNLAEYDAKFEFILGDRKPFIVPKGGTFRLEGYADTTYKVIDIQEDNAVISPLKSDGTPDEEKKITIKKQ